MIAGFLGLLLAYTMGSLPTGYLLGRWLKKIDIREYGSKNVGATNVFRVLGPTWGIVALIVDILKGFLAVIIIYPLFMQTDREMVAFASKLAIGFAAVSGHTWNMFLRFKGGKGVATICGVFLAIAPYAVLCSLGIWFLVVFISRYVSLSSISAAISCPVWVWGFYRGQEIFPLLFGVSLLIPVLIVYTHRANIKRLLAGTEHKITDSSKRI